MTAPTITRSDQRATEAQPPGVAAGTDHLPPTNDEPEPTNRALAAGTDSRTSHPQLDTHEELAGAGTNSAAAITRLMPSDTAPLPPDIPADHRVLGAQVEPVGGEHDSDNGQRGRGAQSSTAVVAPSSATPAMVEPSSNSASPGGADSKVGPDELSHSALDSHWSSAALADPTLALLADVLDDLERTRIANENRLRQLTRTEADSDGLERGFGLDETHPDVARLAGIVDGIAKLEHQAELNLNRQMRAHPLGAWVKAQKGVGEKQAARLLAAIGDPYWNFAEDRPRSVSQLWAYCGLHTLPVGQTPADTQTASVDGINVAARRRKGQRANWSATAKMRAWNIAGSMLKAGNRETYDKRKAATEGRLHAVECVRCGPSGKPALPGTPWSDGHRHADALRIVSKELLRQLWVEAKRLHEEVGQ